MIVDNKRYEEILWEQLPTDKWLSQDEMREIVGCDKQDPRGPMLADAGSAGCSAAAGSRPVRHPTARPDGLVSPRLLSSTGASPSSKSRF